MGVARKTGYKVVARWLAEGEAGLQDRSSRPRRSPTRVPARVERKIERLRRRRKLGPMRIGWRLGLASSTVYRVLCRLGLNRLAWLDRPTGRVIRRLYEHPRPGDLLHIDVKEAGPHPPGGGWRAHGRGRDGHGGHSRVGYAYIHSAVDDHSRVAYSEVLADERAVTAVAFWQRARSWFAERGVSVRAVLTDNGFVLPQPPTSLAPSARRRVGCTEGEGGRRCERRPGPAVRERRRLAAATPGPAIEAAARQHGRALCAAEP